MSTHTDTPTQVEARVEQLCRAGAPSPWNYTVHQYADRVSLSLTVSASDFDAWVALGDADGEDLPTVWVGPEAFRVWCGHLDGIPSTVWALDAAARRREPAIVPLSRRPSRPEVGAGERTGEHDVAGYSAALDAAATESLQGGAS